MHHFDSLSFSDRQERLLSPSSMMENGLSSSILSFLSLSKRFEPIEVRIRRFCSRFSLVNQERLTDEKGLSDFFIVGIGHPGYTNPPEAEEAATSVYVWTRGYSPFGFGR